MKKGRTKMFRRVLHLAANQTCRGPSSDRLDKRGMADAAAAAAALHGLPSSHAKWNTSTGNHLPRDMHRRPANVPHRDRCDRYQSHPLPQPFKRRWQRLCSRMRSGSRCCRTRQVLTARPTRHHHHRRIRSVGLLLLLSRHHQEASPCPLPADLALQKQCMAPPAAVKAGAAVVGSRQAGEVVVVGDEERGQRVIVVAVAYARSRGQPSPAGGLPEGPNHHHHRHHRLHMRMSRERCLFPIRSTEHGPVTWRRWTSLGETGLVWDH